LQQVTTELRQGNVIKPIIFNLALKKVVKEATIDRKDIILEEKNIGILAYANNIVLLVESKDKLKQQGKNL